MENILIYLTYLSIFFIMKESPQQKDLFSRLPVKPESYYQGLSMGQIDLPENIIVFSRQNITELLSSSPTLSGNLHYRYVLIINFEDPFAVMVDHRVMTLGRRKGLLIFPYQYHSFIQSGKEVKTLRAVFITFEFRGRSFSADLERLRNASLHLTKVDEDSVIQFSHAYLDVSDEPGRKALILNLAMILNNLRNPENSPQGCYQGLSNPSLQDNPVIPRLCRAIYEDPSLSIEELAQGESLSIGYLRALFRAALNQPLGEYILALRVNRAKILLAGTDQSVSRIGEICGYSTVYSFSRMFRKYTDQSPTQFRKDNTGFLRIPVSRS